METGAGSIDADVGMRFIRSDSAVAAITEAIDCSAHNTSAGKMRAAKSSLRNALVRERSGVGI